MEKSGVITGYGPDVDLAAAGFPVRALVTLEITQGALDRVAADLEGIPGVLEAYAITGPADRFLPAGRQAHLRDRLVDRDPPACPAVACLAVAGSRAARPGIPPR